MKGIFLFDIDGVIRDVTGSYRLAIQQTVAHFVSWRPAISDIDNLKFEGCWNNDWDASMELIKRYLLIEKLSGKIAIPEKESLIKVFNGFYFGGDPSSSSKQWHGFIKTEPILVSKDFFTSLSIYGFKWGFVSGAESVSAKFVLQQRLGLKQPALIAMEDAPEKPNPTGLIRISTELAEQNLGVGAPPIAFLGDTVADIKTIKEARKEMPGQTFISIGIAPPHLHKKSNYLERVKYEERLISEGADIIIQSINEILHIAKQYSENDKFII